MHLRPTKKTLIALAVAAAASIGLAVMVWRTQSRQRAEWEARLAAKRQEADDVETAARQLPETEVRLAEIRYQMSCLRSCSPEDYQPGLLQEVSALAQRCGLALTSFSVQEPPAAQPSPIAKSGSKKVAPHQFLGVSMSLDGSFHNVTRALYQLMGLSKIVSVESVDIQPAEEGPPDAVRANVKMTAYIVKNPPSEMAAAAAQLKEIAEAETKYHNDHQSFATLTELNAAGLISLKEGAVSSGYVFTTEPGTGKDTYKIVAKPKDDSNPALHRLSVDQSQKITDETDKVPYE